MTVVAPGGALYEGPPRPRALLPALGPLGPVVRPVRPVLAPVLRAALPAHLRHRPFLPPKPRTPPHVPAAHRDHVPVARSLPATLVPARPGVPPVLLVPAPAPALPGAAFPGPALPGTALPGTALPGTALLAPGAELPAALLPIGDLAAGPAGPPAVARPRWLALGAGAVAAVSVAAVAVLFSPVGAVRGVEVQGAGPRWGDAVRAVVAPELGRSALLVDTRAVAARIEAVPGVRSASVAVRWPGTLVVEVHERSAAAAVTVGGGVQLLDVTGVDLGTVASAPQGVQQVVARNASGVATRVEGAGVAAALAVRAQLPGALAAEVVDLGASSADGVWFRLRDGGTVVWGGADRAGDKAAVLAALREATPHAARYDVAAPDTPAVSAS